MAEVHDTRTVTILLLFGFVPRRGVGSGVGSVKQREIRLGLQQRGIRLGLGWVGLVWVVGLGQTMCSAVSAIMYLPAHGYSEGASGGCQLVVGCGACDSRSERNVAVGAGWCAQSNGQPSTTKPSPVRAPMPRAHAQRTAAT